MPDERVRLRPITEADLPDYVRWLNDPEVTRWLQRDPGVTLEQEREWFQRISAPDYPDLMRAIEAGGRHVGNCALRFAKEAPVANFGISIGDKSAWGQGYGAAATREMLRIGFEERSLHRIHLDTWARNVRAQRCYEKCGFRREGLRRQAVLKNGEWLDVVSMAILREEWEAMIAPPLDGLCPLRPEHADEAIALWSRVDLWPRRAEDHHTVRGVLAGNARLAVGWRTSGELVATVVGAWDGLRGWIYRVGVLPAYRRQGIASALVREVERRLAAAGARQINLMVGESNEAAWQLYAALGYERIQAGLMRKRLIAPDQKSAEGSCDG